MTAHQRAQWKREWSQGRAAARQGLYPEPAPMLAAARSVLDGKGDR